MASRAFGESQEHHLLVPILESIPEAIKGGARITADAASTARTTCRTAKTRVLTPTSPTPAFGDLTFQGYLNDCRSCPLQSQCLRELATERGRQVSIRESVRENASQCLIECGGRLTAMQDVTSITNESAPRYRCSAASGLPKVWTGSVCGGKIG